MAARRDQCPACGGDVLVELVGRVAALHVRADAHPMPHQQAMAMRGPNRLAWHLHQLSGGGVELRWIDSSTHPKDCTSDVIEHRCPQQEELIGNENAPQRMAAERGRGGRAKASGVGSRAFLGSDSPLLAPVRLDARGHVSPQVIGTVGAVASAYLAEGFPRLLIDADHTLRGSSHGHANRVTGEWAPAVHPARQTASLVTVERMGTRDTLRSWSGRASEPP